MSLPLSKLRTTIQAESGRSCLLLLDPTLLRELRALFMPGSIRTETETVIKKILPYLQRRGYDPTTDFDFETPVKTTARYSAGYIDILVTCGRPHPQFVIEAKRSSKRLSNKDRDQAISYARSYAVNAPFVVVTNGSDIRCYNAKNKEPIAWDGSLLQRIPPKSQVGKVITHLRAHPEATIVSLGKDETLPFRPGLALKQLNALFARCHNTIRDVEKNEEHTFADFSKILFLKLLEEKHDIEGLTLPYSYRFYQLADTPDSQADQVAAAVREMLGKLRGERDYRTILAEELQLKKPTTFLRIVRELAAVSFYDSALDSKGAAFEYFVRATLKGKRLGQYFTPRQLVQFMYTLIGAEKVLASVQSGTPIKVLDPACGTGGFLVFMLRDNIAMADKLLEERRITAANHQKIS